MPLVLCDSSIYFKNYYKDFPGGPVDKTPPSTAGGSFDSLSKN